MTVRVVVVQSLTRRYTARATPLPKSIGSPAPFFLEIQNRTGIRQPNAPTPQDVLVGQDRVGPSSKIWASRNKFCNLLLILQKPPAPVALQGRLCLSAKPHEYKRSLVWLNLPSLAKPGKTQGETATTTLQQ